MRLLPSSLASPPPPPTTALSVSTARQRQRVPAMKLPRENAYGKIGQVQDDQSRTRNDDEVNCTDNFITMRITPDDSFIVGSTQRMGLKHAKELTMMGKGEECELSHFMTSTGETMRAVLNHKNNNNSQTRFTNEREDCSLSTIEGKCRDRKIMSGDQSLLLPPIKGDDEDPREETMYDDDEEEDSGTITFSSKSSSCSQINSSVHLRKVKRTMWRGGSPHSFYGQMCYYATVCLFLGMMVSSSWIGVVDAITTSGERGDKSFFATGTSSHKLSERSAAIVKLEPDYQPIIFPKKDYHLEDNHLHSQSQQQSFNDKLGESEKFDESGVPVKAEAFTAEDEHILSNPTSIPESSRSTIIFRGIRNRTRVEVGPVNLFTTKRKPFSDEPVSNRRGRVMFSKSEPLNEREDNSTLSGSSRTIKSDSAQSSEEGSSRKASPDVQDIIDGIVKLLGGKVHHPQPGAPVAAIPQIPFSQRQPQSTAYNLFNPNKPIYYQTAKPSRINSRGPPLPGGNNPNSGAQTEHSQQSSQQQSSFEAIPLEALNSDFKLNQTRFGPPFPLSQVVSQVPPEAPYKQGVPLPEQLVPPTSSNPNYNGNFNLRPPPPTSFVTTDGNNDNRPGNGFYANGHNRYNNDNVAQSQKRPSVGGGSLPPYTLNNANPGLTTVPTSLTTTPNRHITHHYHHHQHQQADNFNENGTRNPYYSTSSSNLNNDSEEDRQKPYTTISSSDEGSEGGNPSLTTTSSNAYDKNLVENNRALSSPRPPLLSLTVPTGPEDDEEDDLRFTTNVEFDIGAGQNGIKWNQNPTPDQPKQGRPESSSAPPVSLEPTITEDSQLPSWTSTNFGRVGSSKETVFDFSDIGGAPASVASSDVGSSNGAIRPTSANSLYPTLVLETNSENGLVEIVTKLAAPAPPGAVVVGHTQQHFLPESSTSQENSYQQTTEIPFVSAAFPTSHQQPHPDSNLRKQVQHFNTLISTTKQTPSPPNGNDDKGISTQSIHSLPTPPLRPGIVINDGPAVVDKGYGSVEVVTVDENGQKIGEVFDVTVTAKQSFGGKKTGVAFTVKDHKDDLVITQPTGTEQYVSIDGKRTYFSLHPNTPTAVGAGSATKAVGQVLPVENKDLISVEVSKHPGAGKSPLGASSKSTANQNIGVGTVGNPVPLLPQPPGKTLFGMGSGSGSAPVRGSSVSTSLSISGGSSLSMTGPSGVSGSKTLPNLIRRPHTRRPAVPPVRIDTCIVGDDSTCNVEQGEVCRTESGVSSCVCRSGYARRRHREPCKAIVSLVMSIKLDKLGDKKLSYNPDYFNPNSELYQTLEWETIHAMDSAMGETTLSAGYVGSKLEAIGFDGRHAVVNTTVLIQENPKQSPTQVKRDLQKQMIQVLTRNRNNFGKSQLWVEGPISAVAAIGDFDECESPETNDCDTKAHCVNTLGSFECKCESGYGDQFEKDKRRSGRRCESCNGKTYCNGRGDCLIENGQKVCKCAGNYYGSQCDIDGEVLAVAIGASISAVVIIGLTLACLCMWSRKWKREEQKAALMSRTLFGGMATQALSYLGKNNSNHPYQQHLSMDDRLRWAQAQEVGMGGNIYVQNEPMSMHTSPQLIGTSMMETPPLMSARRSAETVDTTIDDIYDDRQTKRPRSRASQMQGSLYYDLEPEPKSDIYASRSMVQFPAQFCVPMGPMSHYAPPNRGYYP